MVISGYELRRGKLWLHIDDPNRYKKGKKAAIGGYIGDALEELKKTGEVDRIPASFIEDAEPDFAVDPENPGIRYWLRARVLFFPNARTDKIHTDTWGDHGDPLHKRNGSNRWGMSMYYTFVDTPRTDLVEAVPFATYPVRLPGNGEPSDAVLSTLWQAVAESGAQYPLDKFKIWNNGIRIPKGGVGRRVRGRRRARAGAAGSRPDSGHRRVKRTRASAW